MRSLLFSIDAEPDSLWTRTRGHAFTHDNIAGITRALPLFEQRSIKPTFFVSYSVASSDVCTAILQNAREKTSGEIGTHFHPCDTPPFSGNGERETDNILRVDDGLLTEKFERLHAMILGRFGKPVSYRSGAWTIDKRIVALLAARGYRVDSSVTPGISWSLIGRPSYQHAPRSRYVIDVDNMSKNGSSGIIELPVSIWPPRSLLEKMPSPVSSFFTMPMASKKNIPMLGLKALRRIRPKWLRPAFQSLDEMKAIAGPLLEKSGFLHVMCHSTELAVGTSPYVQNAMEQKEFFHRLEGVFRLAADQGCTSATLSEYAQAVALVEKDESRRG